jgi:phosphate transport system protein
MTTHLHKDVDKLKAKILLLAAMVEENLREAVKAFHDGDDALAEAVITKDLEIDQMELEVEEDCLKALALHQPVAIDLRFIIAILKIDNDLERIGDLAANIADRVRIMSGEPPIRIPPTIGEMSVKVQAMLRLSLDALVNLNPEEAREVLAADDEVDDLNRAMYAKINKAILEDPTQVEQLIPILTVSRFLERISDHATNISEDVIYMVEGDIVRHQGPPPNVD